MIKLHVMSDIHFEYMESGQHFQFWDKLRETVDKDQPDVLVLAGDIGTLELGVDGPDMGLDVFCEMYPNVIYTPGNHEYFGTSFESVHQTLEEAHKNIGNFHFLRPDHPTRVGDTTFSGGTMWYPKVDFRHGYIDYRMISDSEPGIEIEHQKFMDHKYGDVVISHMLPSSRSIDPKFGHMRSNAFFYASDVEQRLEIESKAGSMPKLWIHGHTHVPFDYQKYGMRVYCNPGGYPTEDENPNFWERLLVEV